MRRSIGTCWRILALVAAVAVVAGAAASEGAAQTERRSPGLFKSNPQKREQPVKISSISLEVRDKDKRATFTGDVHVTQGDTDLRCNTLIVYYQGEGSQVGTKASSKGGNQSIRRMEAVGSVVMTQHEQRAVGDRAEFDVPKNVMILSGNVVVTRGEDVLRGQRLQVDMNTGIYRMESGGGRVEGMFKSNSGQQPPRPGRSN